MWLVDLDALPALPRCSARSRVPAPRPLRRPRRDAPEQRRRVPRRARHRPRRRPRPHARPRPVVRLRVQPADALLVPRRALAALAVRDRRGAQHLRRAALLPARSRRAAAAPRSTRTSTSRPSSPSTAATRCGSPSRARSWKSASPCAEVTSMEPVFRATLAGHRTVTRVRSVSRAAARHACGSWKVMALIRWQGIRLWLRRVPRRAPHDRTRRIQGDDMSTSGRAVRLRARRRTARGSDSGRAATTSRCTPRSPNGCSTMRSPRCRCGSSCPTGR